MIAELKVEDEDKFQTEDALHHAVTQWSTWHDMVNVGLPVPREHPKPKTDEAHASRVMTASTEERS